MMKLWLSLLTAGLFFTSVYAHSDDPYLWLEEVESPQSMHFVRQFNSHVKRELASTKLFREISNEFMAIANAKDKLVYPSLKGEYVYDYFTDAKNPRGIWRRMTHKEFQKKSKKWEVLLDIDQLSKTEKKSWVFKGPIRGFEEERVLIQLSEGGTDAAVIREFDMPSKTFVTDGFSLPASKSHVAWIDRDTLLLSLAFTEEQKTNSQYAMQVAVLKRGQDLKDAKIVYSGAKTDLSIDVGAYGWKKSKTHMIYRYINRHHSEVFILDTEKLSTSRVEKPEDADIWLILDKEIFIFIKTDSDRFKAGSLVSLPLSDPQFKNAELVFAANDSEVLEGIIPTKTKIYLKVLKNVQTNILDLYKENAEWKTLPSKIFPQTGSTSIFGTSDDSDFLYFSTQDFLVPPSIYSYEPGKKPKLVQKLPSRFDESKFVATQEWASSRDGTKVPYFLITPKGLENTQERPVHIYGYGGFENSLTPYYLSSLGKTLLSRGISYAYTNIRGGSEFGPKWHQAALKQNRQRSYDDFIAVAEDLVKKKISAPKKMTAEGASNGGLLTGNMLVQRPDLFAGLIIGVPLLDMERYHLLLVGSSWASEYGTVEEPENAHSVRAISPYRNVTPGQDYPLALITSSTKDDRVHPGHARKMAMKLFSMGYPVYFYESTEGGHAGGADLKQRVFLDALEVSFVCKVLLEKLGSHEKS